MSRALISTERLTKTFTRHGGFVFSRQPSVYAVSDINIQLSEGETLGIVGESGSGKTTLARLLLQLEKPTSGIVRFRGRAFGELNGREVREFRNTVQAVFQDPYSSLSPRMRIGEIVAEPLVVARGLRGQIVQRRVGQVLEQVGLKVSTAELYPHELSGGQRQRVAIARALAAAPKAIVLDEPVSSLDVSIRAQVLNLLRQLQRDEQLAYLFISHDLSSVRYLCQRIAVMYLGRAIEEGPADAVLSGPLHPYTQLLRAAALPRWKGQPGVQHSYRAAEATLPSKANDGCNFAPRCPQFNATCLRSAPLRRETRPGHFVACHEC
ncbi:MAG: ABC transporter ATP-binding protein [Betaproteobacteria bacterium]|nr:MAG: ABC transporter ATP-binding protein [Betaproteobacteria bacterium]